MLGGGLLLPRGLLGAQSIQGPEDLRGHADPAPLLGSSDERGKEEREARPLPGEA